MPTASRRAQCKLYDKPRPSHNTSPERTSATFNGSLVHHGTSCPATSGKGRSIRGTRRRRYLERLLEIRDRPPGSVVAGLIRPRWQTAFRIGCGAHFEMRAVYPGALKQDDTKGSITIAIRCPYDNAKAESFMKTSNGRRSTAEPTATSTTRGRQSLSFWKTSTIGSACTRRLPLDRQPNSKQTCR